MLSQAEYKSIDLLHTIRSMQLLFRVAPDDEGLHFQEVNFQFYMQNQQSGFHKLVDSQHI